MAVVRAWSVAWVAVLVVFGGCWKKERVITARTQERLSDSVNQEWALTPRVGGAAWDVNPPRLLSRVEPRIPATCRKATIQGLFMWQVTVSETGAVESLQMLKAPLVSLPCPELEAEARRSLADSKYEPTVLNGRPVRVALIITQSISIQ
jgi:outer membrane biosynthesis protein TonB